MVQSFAFDELQRLSITSEFREMHRRFGEFLVTNNLKIPVVNPRLAWFYRHCRSFLLIKLHPWSIGFVNVFGWKPVELVFHVPIMAFPWIFGVQKNRCMDGIPNITCPMLNRCSHWDMITQPLLPFHGIKIDLRRRVSTKQWMDSILGCWPNMALVQKPRTLLFTLKFRW